MDINTTIKAQLREDNAGGLHYVLGDGRSCSMPGVYDGHSQAGKMLADILSLEGWIDDARKGRPDEADTVAWDDSDSRLIAERDGGTVIVRADAAGASGSCYIGTE